MPIVPVVFAGKTVVPPYQIDPDHVGLVMFPLRITLLDPEPDMSITTPLIYSVPFGSISRVFETFVFDVIKFIVSVDVGLIVRL